MTSTDAVNAVDAVDAVNGRRLSAGYVVGDVVHYTGMEARLPSGDMYVRGRKGEVVGPGRSPKELMVHFTGNHKPTSCLLRNMAKEDALKIERIKERENKQERVYQEKEAGRKATQLTKREAELEQRAKELDEREARIARRESTVVEREDDFSKKMETFCDASAKEKNTLSTWRDELIMQEARIKATKNHVTEMDTYISQFFNQCAVCGRHTRRRCQGCKSVYYCSRKCQKVDWRDGAHRKHCSSTRA